MIVVYVIAVRWDNFSLNAIQSYFLIRWCEFIMHVACF